MQSTATVCGTPTTFTTLVYSDRVLITVSQGLPGFGCLVSAMREPSNGPGGGVGGLTVSRVLGGARAEEADYPSLAARHVALAMEGSGCALPLLLGLALTPSGESEDGVRAVVAHLQETRPWLNGGMVGSG